MRRAGDKQKAWEEYKVIIDEIIFDGKLDEAINILTMFIDTEPVETRKSLWRCINRRTIMNQLLRNLFL